MRERQTETETETETERQRQRDRDREAACCHGIGVLCIIHQIHPRLQNSAGNLRLSSIPKVMLQ